MKYRRLLLLSLCCGLLGTSSVRAAEQYLEFTEALRQRGYYDTALEYLEWADAQPNLPKDVKEVIPYEKAMVLLESARGQNPARAGELVDRGRAFLQQFVKASPNHPLAARANSRLATTYREKAHALALQARLPANVPKKNTLQREARDQLTDARKMFQAAVDQTKKALDKFPIHVDKQSPQFEEREAAEVAYVQAVLDAALVTYEEAQTYDRGTADNKRLLTQAAKEFEAIHQKFRHNIGGLWARTYEGKCYEEQEELQKALGIYKEVMSAEGGGEALRRLQDRVFQFQLQCYNNEKKPDYQLTIKEAEAWLAANKSRRRTMAGEGVIWELARAQEAMSKTEGLTQQDINRWLRQAGEHARELHRSAEYRGAAMQLSHRIDVALNRDAEPKDFETALGQLVAGLDDLKRFNEQAAAAQKPADRTKAEQDRKYFLIEMLRKADITLSLVKPDTPMKEVIQARYLAAYINFQLGRNYDAAVLGEYIARRFAKEEEAADTVSDAAYIALSSYTYEYANPENRHKEVDLERIKSVANLIATNWPGSNHAVDAYMSLGRIYANQRKPEEAAKWFDKIPETANDSYLKAQMLAGQAYWGIYLNASNLSPAERPKPEQLAEYQKIAQDKLKAAIGKSEAKLAEGDALPADVATAKLTLAQMANASLDYKTAVELIATGKRPVISATAIDPEIAKQPGFQLPPTGPKSKAFRALMYRELLRAYIGLQDLEAAQKAMGELETLAGAADVTPLYIQFGKQLKEELNRLKSTNEEQYQQVSKSFESFLENMLNREQGQTYGSLTWVGETYMALGEEAADKGQAVANFNKAAKAFQTILSSSDKDPKFATPKQRDTIEYRLTVSRRRAGEFDQAEALVNKILKAHPRSIEHQMEAAYLYQDWAGAGGANALQKWEKAIYGSHPPGAAKKAKSKGKGKGKEATITASGVDMWGWAGVARELDRQMQSLAEKGKDNPEYEEQFLEARYNLAFSRRGEALAQPKKDKSTAMLASAQRDCEYTAALRELDDNWYKKFSELHRSIQNDLHKVPVPLARGVEAAKAAARASVTETVASTQGDKPAAAGKGSKKKGKEKTVAKAEPKKNDSMMIWFGGFVLLSIGIMGAFLYMSTRPRKRVTAAASTPAAAAKPAQPPPAAKAKPKAPTKA